MTVSGFNRRTKALRATVAAIVFTAGIVVVVVAYAVAFVHIFAAASIVLHLKARVYALARFAILFGYCLSTAIACSHARG